MFESERVVAPWSVEGYLLAAGLPPAQALAVAELIREEIKRQIAEALAELRDRRTSRGD